VSRVFQIARQRSFDPGAGIRLSRPQARRPLVPLCAPLAGSSRSRPSAARGLARHARRRVEPLLAGRSQTFRRGPRLRPAAVALCGLRTRPAATITAAVTRSNCASNTNERTVERETMATVAYILLGLAGLIGLVAVIWRVGSRRRSVPCPVWL